MSEYTELEKDSFPKKIRSWNKWYNSNNRVIYTTKINGKFITATMCDQKGMRVLTSGKNIYNVGTKDDGLFCVYIDGGNYENLYINFNKNDMENDFIEIESKVKEKIDKKSTIRNQIHKNNR